MRSWFVFAGAVLIGGALSGCSAPDSSKPAAADVDANLRCAAMISAADRVMASGAVALDAELDRRALIAGTTFVNAYAIPKDIKEKDAFAAVDKERAQILGSMQPAQIVEEAKACLERMPAS